MNSQDVPPAPTTPDDRPPIGRAYFRGESTNRMPYREDMRLPGAISEFVLKGWMPPAPVITRDMNVVAFGSCFAANIGRYLADIGFNIATERPGVAYVQQISDGLVNVYAILQQFEWAWEARVPEVELWHGWKAEQFGYDPDVRAATKVLFDEADVFVLTFGLSEIWYDEPTGEVFWRAVPEGKFDPTRHKFRLASYEETLSCLRRIRSLIRRYRPNAQIIVTLSPIGLAATFRPVSCITANAVSKATLRVAIDALYREVHADDARFFYFPSYEVVNSGFQFPFDEDLRHISPHVLHANMKAFERYFCMTDLTDQDLQATLVNALEIDELMIAASEPQRERLRMSDQSWQILNSGSTGPQPIDIERNIRLEKRLQAAEAQIEANMAAHAKASREREAKLALREARLKEKAARVAASEQRRLARDREKAEYEQRRAAREQERALAREQRLAARKEGEVSARRSAM